MSNWSYKGNEILDESQFHPKALAFVYRIVRKSDGKMYIGKKLCYFKKTSIKTIVNAKGVKKKKKTLTLVPSDWKTYWSSSPELQKDVALLGETAFTREILCWCQNKGSANYLEARYQMDNRVLELSRDKTYNGIINLRCHWTHVKISDPSFFSG